MKVSLRDSKNWRKWKNLSCKCSYRGKPKNYKLIGLSSTPETIFIEATDSVVNSIGEIKVFVDVSNITSEMVVQKECVVYDKW